MSDPSSREEDYDENVKMSLSRLHKYGGKPITDSVSPPAKVEHHNVVDPVDKVKAIFRP